MTGYEIVARVVIGTGLMALLVTSAIAFFLIRYLRGLKAKAMVQAQQAVTTRRFQTGDRVVLQVFDAYLCDYHGATPGTLGTVIGDFWGSSPGSAISTCMVKWDTGENPVRCSFDEIQVVDRVVSMRAHRLAKEMYGEGPDAVSRRVGFEAGVEWLGGLLPPQQMEELAQKLELSADVTPRI